MTRSLQPIEQQVKKALLEALLCFSQEKNSQANKLCIALSGGIDSIVLLHIVDRLIKSAHLSGLELEAFHVDHGISQFSKNWRDFCNQECKEKNIPFFSAELNLKKVKQQSLEADARNARYQALCEHAENNTLILLGQHQSDQAETLLLQLKRGSGLAGLASMPLFMFKRDAAFARPLLRVSKQLIVDFASKLKLKWCEDNSNTDESFDRNYIRMNVVPIMQSRWPQVNETMARVADNCAIALQVNNEYMTLLTKSLLYQNKIDIVKLAEQSEATKLTFLQYCLAKLHKQTLTKTQLESLLGLCDKSNSDTAYMLFGTLILERFQNNLLIYELTEQELKTVSEISQANHSLQPPIKVDLSKQISVKLDEFNELHLLSDIKVSKLLNKQVIEKKETNVINQSWCENNNIIALPSKQFEIYKGVSHLKLKYHPNRPTKSLKSWFQEWKVSPIQRRLTATITHNGNVCAVLTSPIKVATSNLTMKDEPVFVRLRTKDRVFTSKEQ